MRHKSKKYPGVFWRLVDSVSRQGQKERSYYVIYKKNGKTIEAKAGLQFRDDMTEPRAANYRAMLIEGKELTPEEKRKQKKVEEEAAAKKITMEKLWNFFTQKKERFLKSFEADRSRWEFHLKPAIADLGPEEIKKEHIDSVADKMRTRGLSRATIKQVETLFKRIINLGVEYEKCKPLTFHIKAKKLENERTRFLTPEEAERLLNDLKNNPKGKNTHDICLLSLNSGMRFGEIANLKWHDVNLDIGSIYIANPKNEKARTVFMNKKVREMFESRDPGEPGDLVFPDRKHKPRKQISGLFWRSVKRLGFNFGITDSRQRICFHSLRHTYASWAVQSGIDLFKVQKALGHSDSAMTERYSHLGPDSVKAVSDAVELFQDGKIIPLKRVTNY